MALQTITLNLSESVYERIKMMAHAVLLSPEELLTQSISFFLPAFESDLPSNLQRNIAKLALLNDLQLWKTANFVMEMNKQRQFEELAELKKHRSLTEEEQIKLEELMAEAEQIMLCKAEARRLLKKLKKSDDNGLKPHD
ncbi:MAG: hypothetical protein BWK80_49070 [Desulfobacteraceae bacterium IS3]|nr:MAG: hypothetical protein BWK80_49070 [Desulfobacteraceae bacterium IS3]